MLGTVNKTYNTILQTVTTLTTKTTSIRTTKEPLTCLSKYEAWVLMGIARSSSLGPHFECGEVVSMGEFAGPSLHLIPISGLVWSLYKCAPFWRAVHGPSPTEIPLWIIREEREFPGWPGCYINVRICRELSMVLLQLKYPFELFVKRGNFLVGLVAI